MKIKQAASYQDQVRILKSKGLIIEDKNDCMQFLKHTNYYRFSAYCESFRYEGKGRFIEGTTFDQIRNVYMFDQKLRAWLFEVVEEIELLCVHRFPITTVLSMVRTDILIQIISAGITMAGIFNTILELFCVRIRIHLL